MEILASIFVFLVLVADGFLPKADLAKNLGILPEEKSGVLSATANNAEVSKREENGELAGKSEQERLEFRQRLQEIKDEKKRKGVETIDENIAKNNEKWTNHLTDVLNRLSAILEKIKIKTDEAENQGKDVTEVRDAIIKAQESIADAQLAVEAQREEAYTIIIGSEENLGQSVSTTVKSFKTNIKSVFEKVKAARQAVRDVLKSLKIVLEENNQ